MNTYKIKSVGDSKIAGKKYKAGVVFEVDENTKNSLLLKGSFEIVGEEKKVEPKIIEEKKEIKIDNTEKINLTDKFKIPRKKEHRGYTDNKLNRNIY